MIEHFFLSVDNSMSRQSPSLKHFGAAPLPADFLSVCLRSCVHVMWDRIMCFPLSNRSMSFALAVKSIQLHTPWPPNKNTLQPAATSPDSLKRFYFCALSPHTPPHVKINRVREGAGNFVEVASGIFNKTRRSQERYESLMRDVSAPRRGNVLKTWLWAHGEGTVSEERKRKRDIKEGEDKRLHEGQGGKEGYVFLKISPLKAEVVFQFCNELSCEQMCSHRQTVWG